MYNNWRINFGSAYKIQNISYDFSKAVTEEENDPVISDVEKKWNGNNMDLGIEFISNTLVLGLSSQNLISVFNTENSLQTNTNFLYGMYKRDIDSFFSLLLGICAINNVNIYQAEFNVTGIVYSKKLPVFRLGVFYRTKKEMGALFGIDLSKTVRLAMSYDYHVGDISYSSYGTPEVLLLWKFGKLKNCDCEGLFK
jgi:type IX secretion system PorP/SprF family membrane protein